MPKYLSIFEKEVEMFSVKIGSNKGRQVGCLKKNAVHVES